MSVSGKNPFLDEDEVDDFEFLSHHPQGQSGYLLGEDKSEENCDWTVKQKLLLEEKRKIEERTLQSTTSSLIMIHESEQVGIATAEELVCQREQLQNVETNLDKINATMKISQKHINSIKSMFGGLKSYFSGGSSSDTKKAGIVSPTSPTNKNNKLNETIGGLKNTQKDLKDDLHPALRSRGISYDDQEEDEMDYRPNQTKSSVFQTPSSSQDYENKFNENLEDLSLGLGRLKNLAIGLNTEIEDQNEMIGRIYEKADRADDTIEYQNRQIKRILKK